MKERPLHRLALLLAALLLPWAALAEAADVPEAGVDIVVGEDGEAVPQADDGVSLLELEGIQTPEPTAEPTPEPTEKPPKIPWLTSFNYPKDKVSFEKEIWAIMTGKWGLTDFQAAGLMSSLQAESAFCPYNAEGIGGSDDRGKYLFDPGDSVGFGLCQWTTSGRKSALLSYAVAHGGADMVWDFDIQMAFMGSELDVASLRTAENLYDVAEWAVLRYERPNLAYANAWPGTRYEMGRDIYRRHTGRDYDEPALRFAIKWDGESLRAGDTVALDGDGTAELTVRSNYYWRLEQADASVPDWLDIQCASPYDPEKSEPCVCGYASDGEKVLKLTALRKPGVKRTWATTLRFEIYRGERVRVAVPVTLSGPESLPPLTDADKAGLCAALLGVATVGAMIK